MNQRHLTAVTRTVSHVPSRRDVLRSLTSVGLGLTALRLSPAAVAKRKHHKKGKKRKHTPQQPPSPSSPPPSPPNRVTRVDATCAGAKVSAGGSRDGNVRVAQTFTALSSGLLVTAEVPIMKQAESVGDYVLRLSPLDSGFPTNMVLAEAVVANTSVPIGGREGVPVTFTFGTPASVAAGTQYALVLTRPAGDLLAWRGDLENPCTGRSFSSSNQTEPFTALDE